MTLKEKLIQYRGMNPESRVLLGTLLGELDRNPKVKNKNPTDAQVVSEIKKMIQTGSTEEQEILEQFLPQQLTDVKVDAIISSNGFSNIGECMKFFKENYAGLYDGKVVSTKFRALS